MSFLFSSNITLISLLLSVISIALVIIFAIVLSRKQNSAIQDESKIEVSAIVSEFGERQKRLEQRLIDEKVRLEILELRLVRPSETHQEPKRPIEVFSAGSRDLTVKESIPVVSVLDQLTEHTGSERGIGTNLAKTGLRKDAVVLEILQAVLDAGNKATARDIQQKIGRSREHTARMMNSLYKEGLVSRDNSARPFTYSLTDLGSNELR